MENLRLQGRLRHWPKPLLWGISACAVVFVIVMHPRLSLCLSAVAWRWLAGAVSRKPQRQLPGTTGGRSCRPTTLIVTSPVFANRLSPRNLGLNLSSRLIPPTLQPDLPDQVSLALSLFARHHLYSIRGDFPRHPFIQGRHGRNNSLVVDHSSCTTGHPTASRCSRDTGAEGSSPRYYHRQAHQTQYSDE